MRMKEPCALGLGPCRVDYPEAVLESPALAKLFHGHGFAAAPKDGGPIGEIGVVDWEGGSVIGLSGGVAWVDFPVLFHTAEYCAQGLDRAAR